jgi:hypothetical protein
MTNIKDFVSAAITVTIVGVVFKESVDTFAAVEVLQDKIGTLLEGVLTW